MVPLHCENRLGITTISFQLNNSRMEPSYNGPLNNQLESQTGNLCLSGYPLPDPLAYAMGSMSLSWKEIYVYIISPPSRFLLRFLLEIRLQDHSDCVSLAKVNMFPDLLVLSRARHFATSYETRPTVSIQRESCTPRFRDSSF